MAAASVSLHRCLLSPASTLQNREKRPMLSLWQLSKKKKKKADRSTAGAGGGVISVERKKEMGGRGEDLAVLKIGSCGASLMAEIAGGVLRVQRLLSFHYGRSLRWFSTDAGILLETLLPPGMETKSVRQAKLRLGEAVVMLLQTEMLEKMKAKMKIIASRRAVKSSNPYISKQKLFFCPNTAGFSTHKSGGLSAAR
ncbi:hypothetical protein AXF42_Ash002114 [Apostasia shenzhenica]|uniref:Uncharacterized protein n=1 Tax=Apostasia shenzhenica TaxID=1088818 RepID=A0A2I0AMM1_9ASPA|nr:hypothetical protein AXF42_Ash002114 [Apostasia shenzhenica]